MKDLFYSVRENFAAIGGIWGRDRLETHAAAWLEKRLSWRKDVKFAEKFAAGVPVAGASPRDYLQRVVDVGGTRVLMGIRFRGERTHEPFVDLDAWDGPLDLAAATEVARDGWAVFEPKYARVLRVGEPDVAGATLDQSVHAARAADVADGEVDSSVALVPWDDADAAAAVVAEVYDGFGDDFRQEVVPASAETLAWCRDEGVLCRIVVDGEAAGVWATAPDAVDWLPGQVVVEECLLPRFRGRGLAVSVQRLGAALLMGADVLLGTIAAVNGPSRETAVRAGRAEALRYSLLPLA